MNYLAHILLSGSDREWQLGGYLGDFIKGPLQGPLLDCQGDPWSESVRKGVQLHRMLDARLDSMPEYVACVELLGPQFRRVGGIAMDVLFDHLLVNNWEQFSDTPLQPFSRRFYRFCAQNQSRLPTRAASFIEAAARHDLFIGYGEEEVFLRVIERIEARLRYPTNLVGAGDMALQQVQQLQQLFLQIMPLMIDCADAYRHQILALGPTPDKTDYE